MVTTQSSWPPTTDAASCCHQKWSLYLPSAHRGYSLRHLLSRQQGIGREAGPRCHLVESSRCTYKTLRDHVSLGTWHLTPAEAPLSGATGNICVWLISFYNCLSVYICVKMWKRGWYKKYICWQSQKDKRTARLCSLVWIWACWLCYELVRPQHFSLSSKTRGTLITSMKKWKGKMNVSAFVQTWLCDDESHSPCILLWKEVVYMIYKWRKYSKCACTIHQSKNTLFEFLL